MEAVKVFERKGVPLDWDYDDDADTLYLSFSKPKAPWVLISAKGSLFGTTNGPWKSSGSRLSAPDAGWKTM